MVLATPAAKSGSVSVIQIDFGNVLEVPLANVVKMWPSAGKLPSFGLQMRSIAGETMAAKLESFLGSPVLGEVIPGEVIPGGAAEKQLAMKVPVLGNHVFDVFPWCVLRFSFINNLTEQCYGYSSGHFRRMGILLLVTVSNKMQFHFLLFLSLPTFIISVLRTVICIRVIPAVLWV
jgi:hypothetical protein